MNVKLTIQYDGTRYDGWQRQGNTDNTLQGRLEGVLSRMVGKPVEIQGAGRRVPHREARLPLLLWKSPLQKVHGAGSVPHRGRGVWK